MSTPDQRAMLAPDHPVLSIRRQCTLLALSRSGLYRAKRPAAEDDDLGLMRRIDELFTAWPFLGSRRMAALLRKATRSTASACSG
jgi:putative transposase